jgi:ATP-binding cassette subfamily F protein 3
LLDRYVSSSQIRLSDRQNGQGKSTLAKLITSDLKASKGTVTSHPSLRIGYFSQHIVESLNVASPPLAHFIEHFEALGETVTEQTARGFLGGLGLQGRTASHVPIGLLSGGQKVRLALALLLFKPPQLLFVLSSDLEKAS